jgi:antitoxin component of MazEF toxin-antitoxin module
MRINVYRISGTVVVRLPRDYVKEHEIKKTGFVNVREDEHGNLILTPEVK